MLALAVFTLLLTTGLSLLFVHGMICYFYWAIRVDIVQVVFRYEVTCQCSCFSKISECQFSFANLVFLEAYWLLFNDRFIQVTNIQ